MEFEALFARVAAEYGLDKHMLAEQAWRESRWDPLAIGASSDMGERSGADWDNFMLYAKQVFFANGIHHHYGMGKFMPNFPRPYFDSLVAGSGAGIAKETVDILFDPAVDTKKVSLDRDKDVVLASAVNFYGDDVNAKEVAAFYAAREDKNDSTPLSWGLNSKLVRGADGKLMEQTWKVGGMYGAALSEVVKWLEKAKEVAENPQQAKAIGLLIEYYKTGDLKTWDDFNVAWVQDTTSTVDFINGFVEVYNDPLGRRGSFESCVEVIDPAATRNMRVIQEHAQWFEDPCRPQDAPLPQPGERDAGDDL